MLGSLHGKGLQLVGGIRPGSGWSLLLNVPACASSVLPNPTHAAAAVFNMPGEETEQLNAGHPSSDEDHYRHKIIEVAETVGTWPALAPRGACPRGR
jgi:hypothetical protein